MRPMKFCIILAGLAMCLSFVIRPTAPHNTRQLIISESLLQHEVVIKESQAQYREALCIPSPTTNNLYYVDHIWTAKEFANGEIRTDICMDTTWIQSFPLGTRCPHSLPKISMN